MPVAAIDAETSNSGKNEQEKQPPTPVRSSFLRDCWQVLTSSQFATAIGVVTSYVVRHTLTPRLVGIWSTVRLIVDYAGFGNLGATRAAAVEVAIATGANDRLRFRRVVRAALCVEVASSVLVASGLLLGAFAAFTRHQTEWAIAFAGAAVLLLVRRILTLALTVLRSQLDFQRPSVSRVLGAFLELAFLGGGAYLFGLAGLLAGAVLAELINLSYVLSSRPVLHLGPVPWPEVMRLIRCGAPLAAGALALTAARSVERAVVVLSAPDGATLLGLYTTALLISSRVFDQANLVANVLFPRLGVRLAQTNRPDEVLLLSVRAAALLTAVLTPVCVAAIVVGLPLTAWLLPRYVEGLSAVWGTIVAAALLGGTLPLRHALVTLNFSWRMCVSYAFAAGAGAICTVIAIRFDPRGIELIAWVSAGTAAIAAVGLAASCLRASDQVRATDLLPLLLGAVYLVSAVLAVRFCNDPWLRAVVGTVVSAPAFVVGWNTWRRTGRA